MGHAWVTQHMRDHGLDPQQALEVPRLFFEGAATQAEAGVPAATRHGLKARGHRLEPTTRPLGGGQIIAIDRARGVLIGASEPRKDGMALGY
jgi:gamma-glutamyltranspeptidase/glutathione hydrolase